MSVVSGSLEQALDGILELRPFPAAASRLMAACNDESSTIRDLTDIIKCDTGLTMELLKIANSPLYGFSGAIRTADHATVVLGMRALRDLAVSTAVGDLFDSGGVQTTQVRKALWQHSLKCGCVARFMAEKTGEVAPDEAFLGGVIHDVGKLFILDYDTDGYSQMLSDTCLHELCAAEIDTYGMPHTVIGQRCGQDWGLPDEIIDVIGFHHEPEEADFGGALVDIVFAANHLAVSWFDETEIETTDAEILERVGIEIDADGLEAIKQSAAESIEAISDTCA